VAEHFVPADALAGQVGLHDLVLVSVFVHEGGLFGMLIAFGDVVGDLGFITYS